MSQNTKQGGLADLSETNNTYAKHKDLSGKTPPAGCGKSAYVILSEAKHLLLLVENNQEADPSLRRGMT